MVISPIAAKLLFGGGTGIRRHSCQSRCAQTKIRHAADCKGISAKPGKLLRPMLNSFEQRNLNN
jgi:hypothetical protein